MYFSSLVGLKRIFKLGGIDRLAFIYFLLTSLIMNNAASIVSLLAWIRQLAPVEAQIVGVYEGAVINFNHRE